MITRTANPSPPGWEKRRRLPPPRLQGSPRSKVKLKFRQGAQRSAFAEPSVSVREGSSSAGAAGSESDSPVERSDAHEAFPPGSMFSA
ncbi:hypothetical protein OJAV_G00025930 [Oryzias javanicus]|uniref:Uncharacterized protein n=1 Tax=Oryzias javanicus TaxID=123683 RepID=A0A437DID7_ORYJA|nr:hypothetical protein OJAV_G00025930 [Oryzias javanicus]